MQVTTSYLSGDDSLDEMSDLVASCLPLLVAPGDDGGNGRPIFSPTRDHLLPCGSNVQFSLRAQLSSSESSRSRCCKGEGVNLGGRN